MTDHPITPPPELRAKWMTEARSQDYCSITEQVADRAAQWGADQELEACCRELEYNFMPDSGSLRSARRPKPPSLKERAWKLLECYGTSGVKLTADQCNTIREALEDSNG